MGLIGEEKIVPRIKIHGDDYMKRLNRDESVNWEGNSPKQCVGL